MSSLEEEIDQKIEEKELKAVKGHEDKSKLKKAELLGIKFVTTKKGADLLNDISRVFDLVDVKQDDSKSEPIITNDQIIDQDKKVKFKVPIDFLDHTEYLEYETTEAGLRHFKHLLDQNKGEREMVIAEELAEEMDNLTFYDGVILVWEIFERIVDDYFGEDEKDAFGYRYDLGLMDKIQDILSNEVLNKVENMRKKHLHDLFEIRNSQYTT